VHVLHVNQFYWPYDRGGSGVSTRETAEMQAAAGHRVSVLAQTPGRRDERLDRGGVEIHQLALASTAQRRQPSQEYLLQRAWGQLLPEYHPGMPTQLRRLFLDLKPDLIHTHVIAGVSSRIWALARAMGIPVVHSLHDYYLLCARGTEVRNGRRCRSTCRDCRLFTYRRRQQTELVDGVVGVSRFILRRHLDQGLFADAIVQRVVANSVSAPPLERSPESPGRLRVAFLGRLHPSKGPEALIDALRLRPGLKLQVSFGGTGDPAYRESLERRAAGLPVRFVGQVQADRFLADHDVLVVSSRFEEPFGRIVIEAWAQGLPVLCARRGGAQELVDEGHTGWLFEPDRPAELAELLERLSTGVTEQQRENCRRRAAEFSALRCSADYQRVYEDTLAGLGRDLRTRQPA
jgi:glycosyltransferase involved in cell wall biosynthesis